MRREVVVPSPLLPASQVPHDSSTALLIPEYRGRRNIIMRDSSLKEL
jgi:hypothetical protein